MPSVARAELQTRLKDVAELLEAHAALTGGGRGAPAERQGAAVTKAGVVLLSAATEAYVEDLFGEAARALFNDMEEGKIEKFLENTSRKLNNADVFKTNMLFFNLGLPWVMDEIRWQKFSNDTFTREFNRMIHTRGSIAHGQAVAVRLGTLRSWKRMVENFAPRLESRVADHIQQAGRPRPDW